MRFYRGKRKDTGEWVYGDLVHDWSKHNTKPDIVIQNNIGKYKVFPETVGQEIGIRDKNGKCIFKDDILAYLGINQNEHIEGAVKYGKFNCGCCYGVYGWYIEGGDIRNLEENPFIHVYVKGNIHDNPELLERKDGDSE